MFQLEVHIFTFWFAVGHVGHQCPRDAIFPLSSPFVHLHYQPMTYDSFLVLPQFADRTN
jgi:hypothetical protein